MDLIKKISFVMIIALLSVYIPVSAASGDYTEDFESGKWEAGWSTSAGKGTMSFADGNAHSGTKYVKVGSNELQKYAKSGTGFNVTVWLYDDVSAAGSVGVLRAIKGANGINVGVYTAISKSNYVIRIGTSSDSWQPTVVARETGWHRITVDATSSKISNVYIDGVLVGSTRDYVEFDAIELGNPWPATNGNSAGFDDFSITKTPEGADGDTQQSLRVYTDISGEAADRVKVLNALGVTISDGAKFIPSQRVTRDEFMCYIITMMGLGRQAPTDTQFTDVDETNEYSGYIKAASDMGMISGSGGGTFEPKRAITFNEAIKILVLSAGYKNHAAYSGGYAEGYTSAANNAKILKDIGSWRGDQPVTRSDAATLLFNTLETRYIDSIDDDVVVSFMDHYLGVEKLTGIVYTVGKEGIASDKYTSDGMCCIDNTIYGNGAALDIHDFIGHRVTAYIRDDAIGEKELVAVLEKNTQVFRIESEDIIEASLSSISYYRGSVEKKVNVPQGSYFVYNGRAAFDHTIEDMQPEEGYIDLIDYDNDGTYDIVSVTSYKNIYVGSIRKADKIIYDRRDSSKQLDLSGNGDIKIYDGGIPTQFGAITQGALVSYTASKDGELIRAYICRDVVSGNITAINQQDTKIQIDGTWYDYTSDMETEKFSLGDSGSFMLDICGKIAALDIGRNDKYKYGYVIRAYVEDPDIAGVKMFTENGYIERLGFADTFKYNGSKQQPDRLINSGAFPSLELIRYKLDSSDDICEVYAADKSRQGQDTYKDDHDTFWLYEKKNIKYFNGVGFRSSGGTILPDATTTYFYVPEKDPSANEEEFNIKLGGSYKDDTKYNYEAYNVNKVNVPEIMVVYVDESDTTNVQIKTDPLKIFVSITQGINSKGETVDFLNYYKEGIKVSEPVKDGVTLFGDAPDKYSLLAVYNNTRGEITDAKLESVISNLSGATLSNDGRMIWQVTVDEIIGDYMVVRDRRGNTFVFNLPTDRVYMIRGKNVEVGTKSELCVDDYVMLRIYDGTVREAVVNNDMKEE